MNCSNCGKENRKGSRFCRFCGTNLTNEDFLKLHSKGVFLKPKFSRRTLVAGIIILLLGISIAYAAPKVKDYFDIKKAIGAAKDLQAKSDYKDALNTLNAVEGKWMLGSIRGGLENLKKQENNFIQDKNEYDSAISKENAGDLNGARDILKLIPSNFPEYDKVQSELASLQSKIEGQLKATAEAATEAEKSAEQKAAAARAAAAQAAQEKATAQAQAEAQAQAAAQAQAQAEAAAEAAQQAALNAAQQARVSFYNQLSTIYKSFNSDGISYYNQATNYSNASQLLTALAIFGQAQAIFQKAYSDASNLPYSFTNMPGSYLTANQNMVSATSACLQATNAMITGIGNQIDNSFSANSYANSCFAYGNAVSLFLKTTTP